MRRALLAISLLAILAIVGIMLWVARIAGQTHELVSEAVRRSDLNVQSMTAGPWLSGGIPYSVTTQRNAGEDKDAFVARHLEAVDALLKARPKDE